MRFIALMLLLVGVNTFADNHLSPMMAIEHYFSSFNKEDRDALNQAADSPFIFVIWEENPVLTTGMETELISRD